MKVFNNKLPPLILTDSSVGTRCSKCRWGLCFWSLFFFHRFISCWLTYKSVHSISAFFWPLLSRAPGRVRLMYSSAICHVSHTPRVINIAHIIVTLRPWPAQTRWAHFNVDSSQNRLKESIFSFQIKVKSKKKTIISKRVEENTVQKRVSVNRGKKKSKKGKKNQSGDYRKSNWLELILM